ncbi:acetolactate synthase [Nibricoccus sp. IMCC34717]|uniref:acetolactate synthase n=1 Tax=Nibricoccus sp. IMCC34717 TaxID=3034021 RepID=UPI00384C2D6A
MPRTLPSTDPIHQLSVFAENRVGRLHDLCDLLKRHDVHILAITTLDTTDDAIVRMIVDDPEKARELLVNNDFAYSESAITAVEIRDESDLSGVLRALLEVEINIHYVYSFIKRPDGHSALVLSIEDAEVAAQALNQRGFKVLNRSDICR